MEKLTDQEKKALKQAVKECGYYDAAENEETLREWYENGTASINTARNGRAVPRFPSDPGFSAYHHAGFRILNNNSQNPL